MEAVDITSSYFITICTKDRIHFFGNVDQGEMQLNEIGKIADQFWAEIPDHFPAIKLGEYIIMPDHMHGILILERSDISDDDTDVAYNVSTELLSTELLSTELLSTELLSTELLSTELPSTELPFNNKKQMAKISPKAGSIPTIIRSYKSAVTKMAREINPDYGWQGRYHDHIIRDQFAFERIQNYIATNPKKWNNNRSK